MKNNNEVWVTSLQDRQLAACEKLMLVEPLIPMTIIYEEEPLEKTRLLLDGLCSRDLVEVIRFKEKMGCLLVTGVDADGRGYIEY